MINKLTQSNRILRTRKFALVRGPCALSAPTPQYNWTQDTRKMKHRDNQSGKEQNSSYSRLLAVINSSIYDDTTYTILTNSLLSNHRVIRWPLVDQVLLVPSKTLN